MKTTGKRILTAIALVLCGAVTAPNARAARAQVQSDDATPSKQDSTASVQDKPEAKPADKNSAKAKPGENEAPAGAGTEALQKATQNPVATLISRPYPEQQ